MFKNVAAKFIVFAFDATTNVPKTGDAANITAYVAKDYGTVTVLGDTSATEMDATNAPGYYLFDAAQGETNGDCLLVSAKSSTSNIKVIGAPAVIYTRPTTGWLAPATAGRTLVVDASGLADANTVKIGPTGSGTAQTARDVGASVLLSNGTGTGQLKLASGYVAMTWADIAAPTTTVNLSGTTIAVTQKVDVDTIKTNPVVNGGTITFPTNKTLADATALAAVAAQLPAALTAGGLMKVDVLSINAVSTSAVTTVKAVQGLTTADTISALGAATITAASIATGAITNAKFAANAIDAASLATDAAQEIRDGIFSRAMVELTGDPTATPTLNDCVMLPFMAIRNLRATTASQDTIANSAGSTILTASVADDGTTFSKAKYA